MHNRQCRDLIRVILIALLFIIAVDATGLCPAIFGVPSPNTLPDRPAITVFDRSYKTKMVNRVSKNNDVTVTARTYFERTESKVIVELRRSDDAKSTSAHLRISNLILKVGVTPLPIETSASVFAGRATILVIELDQTSESYPRWSEVIDEMLHVSNLDETTLPILEIDNVWYK
ncbi:MAG: hypothetical protein RJS97_02430 [Parvibaculaceae bacterium]